MFHLDQSLHRASILQCSLLDGARRWNVAGGRTKATRRWFVRVSKWHVSVDCGQYRRRTSEGRPTFFPSQHTDKSISTRAVVSRFPAAPASSAGSLTHRPRWNRPPFSTTTSTLLFFISPRWTTVFQHPFVFARWITNDDRFSSLFDHFWRILSFPRYRRKLVKLDFEK